jgi:hypothetical protein
MTPPTQYLTLALKGLGFGTFDTNLLTIPYTVIHMFTMMAVTYAAEIFGELTLFSLTGQIWALPFLIYLNVVDITHVNKWIIWTVTTLLLSYPSGMFILYPHFYKLTSLISTSSSYPSRLELTQR